MLVKTLLAALVLSLSALAVAEPLAVDNLSKPSAEAKAKCVEGCVLLNPQDVDELNRMISLLLNKAYSEGIKEGIKKEKGTI